ncbi:MAG: hypothetical protein QM751_02310 [Paludibacteraceae bacterium]
MFVRKKKNPSGIISIQIIDKSNGKYYVVKTIGSSSSTENIESLYQQGKKWISAYLGEQDVFEMHDKEGEEKQVTEYLLSNVENILLNGVQLILNQAFRLTGFDVIEDEIFRQLVVARLSQPMSKSATVEYLKSHFDEDVQLHRIYRYLDKLYDTQQQKIQQISVEHCPNHYHYKDKPANQRKYNDQNDAPDEKASVSIAQLFDENFWKIF